MDLLRFFPFAEERLMERSPNCRFDGYEIDQARRSLARAGRTVKIEPRVFDLLLYLIAHRERVVSCEELLLTVWGDIAVTPSALSRAIHKARRAVGDDGASQRIIATARGHGFRFVARLFGRSPCTVADHYGEGPPSSEFERALRALSRAVEADRIRSTGRDGVRCALCTRGGAPPGTELPCLALLRALLLPLSARLSTVTNRPAEDFEAIISPETH